MLNHEALNAGAESLLTSALLGEGWEASLQGLAEAAGARGVVLMRNRRHNLVCALHNGEVADPVKRFMAGQTPPSPRQSRVSFGEESGFRLDFDDFTSEELRRDPFYQEFLRPIGFFWHANARLISEGDEWASISFKRDIRAGHYSREDAVMLNSILPDLRAATRVARKVLDAEGRAIASVLQRRGDPLFEMDSWGRVLRSHLYDPADPDTPVLVHQGRLRARQRDAQPQLDRAIAAATSSPPKSSLAAWAASDGSRCLLQAVPVLGCARDVFLATAAVIVVVKPRKLARTSDDFREQVRMAFNMTKREAEIAVLLSSGLNLSEVSDELHLSIGTARNHLKAVLEKLGVRRQAEVAGLLATLRA